MVATFDGVIHGQSTIQSLKIAGEEVSKDTAKVAPGGLKGDGRYSRPPDLSPAADLHAFFPPPSYDCH